MDTRMEPAKHDKSPQKAGPDTHSQTPPQPATAKAGAPELEFGSVLESDDKTEAPKDHDGLKSIISTLAIIIIAPLIALALTAFVFQSYEVDGISMETTLQNQDRLVVLKVPRTWAKITGHPYVPHRGDIIIFNEQNSFVFGTDQSKQLVKRVIGLPGDHVVVKNGTYTIYNAEHPGGFDPDKTLPYGSTTNTLADTTCSGQFCDLTVPQGQIFVSGDNRANSLDSRVFGPISLNDVVGKLSIRIFPFNKLKAF